MTQEIIFCHLCGDVIHRHFATSVKTSVRVNPRTNSKTTRDIYAELRARAIEEQNEELKAAEAACILHFRTNHRLRFMLWQRYGWKRAITWPRRHRAAVLPDQRVFEPMQFLRGLRK